MTSDLAASYRYCERVARREAGNFYLAFRVLPRPQRLAMCALYTFLRLADDLADDAGSIADKKERLIHWRSRWHQARQRHFTHRLHAALLDTVTRHAIPPRYLDEVLDGVEMDLEVSRYDTFADLYRYCYHVASAVGLACIHIWGFRDECAKVAAEAAGIAFQLTNILRDVREDAERGRIYLPREDLQHFQYSEESVKRGERDAHFAELMRFEVQRARGYYESAWTLCDYLDPPGRAVFQIMTRTYSGLLEGIERCGYDVFSQRVRLSRWRKAVFALQALPVRWGWQT
jgi:phytoene synthase